VRVDTKGDLVKVEDDNANKAIFYCGHIAFGYTGLAKIEGEGSDHWLLENLPAAFETFHEVIQEKATEAFKKIKGPSTLKRHAFVGIGWIRTQKTGPLYPSVISISNFQDERGAELPSPNESFSVFANRLPDNESLLIYPVGQPVDDKILRRMYRNIRKRLKKRAGCKKIMEVIVGEVREIAKNSREKIGKNLMAIGMPKKAAGRSLATPIHGIEDYVENMNIFLYFPEDSSDGIIYGPHIKCKGFQRADFTYEHRDGNFVSEFSVKISSTAPDHFNTGMDFLKKHKYEDAITEFDKAIELKPGFAEAWTGKGIAVDSLGLHEKSFEAFNEAIEIKPDLPWAWISKGVALGNLGRLEEALEAFNKAIELKPDDPIAWQKKAWCLAKGVVLGCLGRHDETLEAFSKVIELRPNHANAWYERACYYAMKGDKANVIKNLSKAIYFDNTYKEIARKEKTFKLFLNDEDFKKLIE